MPRHLKGARYLRPDSRVTDLPKAITDLVPTLDMGETLKFYDAFLSLDPTPSDHALLALNDLFYLLSGLCGRRDMLHPWLFDRCREVEAAPDGFLDLWARGHYKSTIVTYGKTMQDVLEDPDLTVGIFSYSRGTAQQFLAQIKREFELNDTLKTCFPDVLWFDPTKEAPKWSADDGIVLKRRTNPKESTIEAWGLVEGQATSKHFALLLYDDMIERRNVTNKEQIQKATEAWELSDNLGIGDKTRKRYIGTRYLLGDTYQTMIDRKAVKVRIHAATDNGRLDGNPVFLSPKTWAEKKISQRSTIAAQMLQNPTAGKQTTFDAAWLRPYEIRPAMMNVYIMADPSRGRTAKSDRTAIAVIGIDSGGSKYLLDGARHRMKLSERWDMLLALHRKWRAVPGVQMIQVGYERYGQQSDDEYFQEKMRALPDPEDQFAIEELAWPREGSNSKRDRVERLQPDFERGRFLLPPVIRHPDLGECFWRYDGEKSQVVYQPVNRNAQGGGLTRLQRAMVAQHQKYRVPTPLTRLDEDGNIYDLTMALTEEMLVFPFGAKDDLIDATARIYDMMPTNAVALDTVQPSDVTYMDA